jgi:hypothetical protein
MISAYHKGEICVAINKANHSACGWFHLQCHHVRGGSEGSNTTAILAGIKEMYQVVFELI